MNKEEKEYQDADQAVLDTYRAYQEAIKRRMRAGFKLPKQWCGACQKRHHPPLYIGSCRVEEIRYGE